MTDILSRLAALISTHDNGLLPCPRCGNTKTLKYENRPHNNVAICCDYFNEGCGLELVKFNMRAVTIEWNSWLLDANAHACHVRSQGKKGHSVALTREAPKEEAADWAIF